MKRDIVTTQLFKILVGCLSFLISGCGGMTIKHVNPDEPNTLESNEKVVFGRIIFTTHSEEMGEVSFAPVGLGLVHGETKKRAWRSAIYEKTVTTEQPSGNLVTREIPAIRPWFENDGIFFWVLPAGSYRFDALGWGMFNHLKVSAEDFCDTKKEQSFPLRPQNPPECGFVISPDIEFNLYGDSAALYIGSLLIDMNVKTEHGMEVKNINRIEIKDEYEEAMKLLKSRFPSFTIAVEKKLMTVIPERPVSVANRRCPTWAELFLRAVVAVAVQFGPSFIPVGPGVSPGIGSINLGFGK